MYVKPQSCIVYYKWKKAMFSVIIPVFSLFDSIDNCTCSMNQISVFKFLYYSVQQHFKFMHTVQGNSYVEIVAEILT